MSAVYLPWDISSGYMKLLLLICRYIICVYINSLIPPLTQNFARNPNLKSNIGGISGFFSRNVRISYSWVRCSLEPHKANYSRNTELGRTCSSGAEIWMGIQAGGARIQPQQEFYVPTGYVLAHRVQ